jgi:hypothetical protein
MLTALLGDTLFYASGGGFLVSVIAFPFILKRFRATPSSSASLDIPSDLREPSAFVEPVKVVEAEPEEPPKPEPKLAETEAAPVPAPAKEAPPPQAAAEPKKVNPSITQTSGLSPAIVYLQNLKIQIEHFEKEIHQLRGQILDFAKKHDAQFDDIVKRMGEMQAEFHQQERAPQASPAPVAPVPEPAPVVPEEAPRPAPVADAPLQIEERTVELSPASVAAAVAVENKVSLSEPVAPAPEPTMPIQIAPEVAVASAPASAPVQVAEDIAQSLTLSAPGQPAAESKPAEAKPAESNPAEAAEGEDDILKPRAKGPVWPV